MEAPLQTPFQFFITSTNGTKINPPKNYFQNLGVLKSHRKSEKSRIPELCEVIRRGSVAPRGLDCTVQCAISVTPPFPFPT
jgi:hypothetical protein